MLVCLHNAIGVHEKHFFYLVYDTDYNNIGSGLLCLLKLKSLKDVFISWNKIKLKWNNIQSRMLCLMALGINIAVLMGFDGDIYVLKVLSGTRFYS